MEKFEQFKGQETDPIIANIGTVNEVLRLHQAHNLDRIMTPFMEFLPDTDDPLQAVLTMQHIYNWPATEIVSILADAQDNPMNYADFQTISIKIHQPTNLAFQLPAEELTFNKREFVIPEPDLPDGFNIDTATCEQLLRRLEISEDILCYFSEGVRRSSADRSPAYMIDSARQIDCISNYIDHLKARIESINFVQNSSSQIRSRVQNWQINLKQIFTKADFEEEEMLQGANCEFPILQKSKAKWQPPVINFTQAQAIAEDCQDLKNEINMMAEKSKSEIAKRADWLAYVAQLDRWREEIQIQPPKREIDWRHDCVTLPAVQLQDDILPTNNYNDDNY